ncbi:MAG: DUF3465 domain-containing protein [Acidobacteriota bacterium]
MRPKHPRRRLGRKRYLFLMILFASIWVIRDSGWLSRGGSSTAGPESGAGAIAEAYQGERSGLWVEAGGEVVRRLPDDLQGSRHQRMIVQVTPEQTILLSHNIDLADRLDIAVGDSIRFRGRYEWNDRGGVVHWTHHDPDGRHQGGWVEIDGQRVR